MQNNYTINGDVLEKYLMVISVKDKRKNIFKKCLKKIFTKSVFSIPIVGG